MKETKNISKMEKQEMEVLQDIREFLSLSRRYMRELELLKASNIPPQYIKITREAVVKVGEKAFLYLQGGSNERLM